MFTSKTCVSNDNQPETYNMQKTTSQKKRLCLEFVKQVLKFYLNKSFLFKLLSQYKGKTFY